MKHTPRKKSSRTERQKRPNDWLFHETMPVRRSWISLVKRPVAQPVEKHRGGARQDHTCEHEEQCAQSRAAIGRDQERPQSEREGEDRMRETNQPKNARDDIRLQQHLVFDGHES